MTDPLDPLGSFSPQAADSLPAAPLAPAAPPAGATPPSLIPPAVVVDDDDRAWLIEHAHNLVEFFDLIDAENEHSLDKILDDIAKMPADEVKGVAQALYTYEIAAAKLPGWLLSAGISLARSMALGKGLL